MSHNSTTFVGSYFGGGHSGINVWLLTPGWIEVCHAFQRPKFGVRTTPAHGLCALLSATPVPFLGTGRRGRPPVERARAFRRGGRSGQWVPPRLPTPPTPCSPKSCSRVCEGASWLPPPHIRKGWPRPPRFPVNCRSPPPPAGAGPRPLRPASVGSVSAAWAV